MTGKAAEIQKDKNGSSPCRSAWDQVRGRQELVKVRGTKGGALEAPEGLLYFCSVLPQPQVTMEEEDESRGKTEESGEDRGDGPPDRDSALFPSAFILVRQLGAVGRGGLCSHFLA